MSATCNTYHYYLCNCMRFASACIRLLLCVTIFGVDASAKEVSAINGLAKSELDGTVWRFDGRELLNEHGGRIIDCDNFHIEEFNDRCDFFVHRNDSVLWTGYNIGRSLGMLMDEPAPVLLSKQLSDTRSCSHYHAEGLLNVSVRIDERGESDCQTLGNGSIVTLFGDSIHNVTLTRQICRTLIYADNYADNDSVERIVHRWYVQGSTVPLAVQINNILYTNFNDKISITAQGNDKKLKKKKLLS